MIKIAYDLCHIELPKPGFYARSGDTLLEDNHSGERSIHTIKKPPSILKACPVTADASRLAR
jgi:hypothetical protein